MIVVRTKKKCTVVSLVLGIVEKKKVQVEAAWHSLIAFDLCRFGRSDGEYEQEKKVTPRRGIEPRFPA